MHKRWDIIIIVQHKDNILVLFVTHIITVKTKFVTSFEREYKETQGNDHTQRGFECR